MSTPATVQPPKKLYAMFRTNQERVATPNSDENTDSPRPNICRLPSIPNLIPPEITTPDSIPSEAFDSITQLASPNNSSISPDDESERPAEDTPNPGEAVQFYLDRKLEEIIQETKGDRPPQCYQDGTFWVRPPDSWFVLQEDFENPYKPQAAPQDPAQINFGPETLYYPSIFVWIPTVLLPKDFAIKCVFCGKDNMGESGWNSNPVARRVSCKKSCNMYNHDVLKQLPPLLRSQFPAFLTHRSGIDKSVMTLIRSTIAHGLTPNGWEHVFRELHVRKRDLAERAYLYALNARAPNKRPTRLTPFSSFSDKNGYAGFSPSRCLWTITNEFEQIRQMILTPTRHLTHIEKPLRGIMKSLHEHGHQPISLLWTDNVRADHQFVEQVVPTLRANVDLATTDGGRKYPVIALPDSLKIRLASSIQLIDQTCRSILADIEQQNTDSKIFVGFSVDWDWQASKSGHFPAALMVIAVADFVHLFQIYHISTPKLVPTALKALLASKQVVKVGYHIEGTLDILTFLWELSPTILNDKTGWIDLGILARSKGLIPQASLSFKRIAEEVIGHTFDGLEDVRCSNWCQENLSDNQRKYAVQNAWLSLHIFKAIVEKPPAGAKLSQIGLPGDKITLRNGAVTVAHGFFAVQMTKFPISEKKTITLSNSKRALITISKIFAPSFICHYHDKTLAEMGEPPFDVVVDLASLVSQEVERDEQKAAPIQDSPGSEIHHTLDMSESSRYDGSGSDSESISESESDDESEPEAPAQPENSSAQRDPNEDEFEQFMDHDLDALMALHPEGPQSVDARHPLVQPAQSNTPWPTRTFQDIFHEMERLTKHISKDHSLAKPFARWLRDAILVPDKIDKARVEAVLKKKGITWDQAVRSKSDWVWQRVRRYIPAPDVLEPVLKKLFATHADLLCSKKKFKLFDAECHKAAAAMLDDVRKGWISDPPGVALYNRLRTDETGLVVRH
ncbi:hypothetical protein B0H13DRAFT_1931512, partial [Mycena leptocephala]